MLVPVIAYYILFKYWPMGGLVIAFKNYNFADGILHSPWVGLKNFKAFVFQLQYAPNYMEHLLAELFEFGCRVSGSHLPRHSAQ